ncbi:hypothetical protein KCW65_26070, partial [Mycobacterium tuberculosis]|nr:hypothetical protein [Mycobacterium tuberculosis]
MTADELTGQILEAVHARLPHTLTKGSGNAADAEAVAESSPPPVTAVAEESETIVLGTPGAPEAPSTGAPDAPGPAAT